MKVYFFGYSLCIHERRMGKYVIGTLMILFGNRCKINQTSMLINKNTYARVHQGFISVHYLCLWQRTHYLAMRSILSLHKMWKINNIFDGVGFQGIHQRNMSPENVTENSLVIFFSNCTLGWIMKGIMQWSAVGRNKKDVFVCLFWKRCVWGCVCLRLCTDVSYVLVV